MKTIFDKKVSVLPWIISFVVIIGASAAFYINMSETAYIPDHDIPPQNTVTGQETIESVNPNDGKIIFAQKDVKHGKTISPEKFEGIPMLVYFWDPSVPKHSARIVKLAALQKTYMKKMIVIGVAYGNTNDIAGIVSEAGLNFPVVLQSAGLTASFSPKDGESLCALVSAERKIVLRYDGFIDFDKLDKKIAELLQK